MRAVIDPNVLISAGIAPHGIPAQIVDAIRTGQIQPVMSPRLIGELTAVLYRDRFRRWITIEQVDRYIADLVALAHHIDDPDEIPAVTRDPKDDYLVALAVATETIIVSGDQDLTSLTEQKVLTPRQLLDTLVPPATEAGEVDGANSG